MSEGVSEADVPGELVDAAADVLAQNGLWGGWEREQTEEEARTILAAVLPLHEQQVRERIARDLANADEPHATWQAAIAIVEGEL